MNSKAIIFDFDGVIVESLDVKAQAFYSMYLPYGETVAIQVRKHHLDNGGMSRFEKFRIYHKTFLNRDIDEDEVMQLSAQFSEQVVKGVIDAPYVNGVFEFIVENYSILDFFIVSGTPTTEMIHIANERGLSPYFREIFGSPESKEYWVKHILEKYRYHHSQCCFVGDALSDYKAATENKIPFILREHGDNRALFEKTDVPRISDFTNLKRVLNNL